MFNKVVKLGRSDSLKSERNPGIVGLRINPLTPTRTKVCKSYSSYLKVLKN